MAKDQLPDILFPDKDEATRLELMKDNCTSTDIDLVKEFFTEEELTSMKAELSEVAIERDATEDELKEVSKGFRDKIKGMKQHEKALLKDLKNKYVASTQSVYHFADHDLGLMATYNKRGELIAQRKLRPNERQATIFEMNAKTA
jgi:hypothetical protein